MRQRPRKVKAKLGERELGGQSLRGSIRQYHSTTDLQARDAISNPRESCKTEGARINIRDVRETHKDQVRVHKQKSASAYPLVPRVRGGRHGAEKRKVRAR